MINKVVGFIVVRSDDVSAVLVLTTIWLPGSGLFYLMGVVLRKKRDIDPRLLKRGSIR